MAYYTVRYSYTTVRTRLEFSETDLRTVSGYDQFAVNSSQVEFLLTVCTNILVKHHPGVLRSRCRKLTAMLALMRWREDLRRQLLQWRKCPGTGTSSSVKVNNPICAVINPLSRITDSVAVSQFKTKLHQLVNQPSVYTMSTIYI